MDARDPELSKELSATLQARKDLGAEYESELVDSFMEKAAERLDRHVEQRVRRELAQQQTSSARADRDPAGQPGPGFARYGFAGFTLVVAIPLSAIGVVNAGTAGLFITWAGIVGVNVAQRLTGSLGPRRKQDQERDDWS
jgi:anti-sigma factor RsiW